MVTRPGARNAVLAAKLRELGLSQTELAEEINSACLRLTGRRGSATDRYVRQLLDGTTLWPHASYRRSLEIIFGCDALALGLVPRASKPLTFAGQRSPGDDEPAQRGALVIRRDFLRVASGTVLAVAFPDLTTVGRVGIQEIDALRSNLAELHALDDEHGGGLVAELAVQQVDRISAVLKSANVSRRIERSLYSLAGSYMSAVGWFALDAGKHEVAKTYLDRAMRAALLARDPLLQAQTWNNMNLQEYRLGNKGEAFAIARTAVASPAMRQDSTVAALLHARVALGHAEMGERGLADRSLGRAAEALSKARGTEPPVWLTFFTPAELSGLGAIAELHLGRYSSAVNRTQETLALLPQGHKRNRLHYMLRLADVQLRARRVDEACSTAGAALTLAQGTHSKHSTVMLQSLRSQMASWHDQLAAQEWINRCDAFLVDAA